MVRGDKTHQSLFPVLDLLEQWQAAGRNIHYARAEFPPPVCFKGRCIPNVKNVEIHSILERVTRRISYGFGVAAPPLALCIRVPAHNDVV